MQRWKEEAEGAKGRAALAVEREQERREVQRWNEEAEGAKGRARREACSDPLKNSCRGSRRLRFGPL